MIKSFLAKCVSFTTKLFSGFRKPIPQCQNATIVIPQLPKPVLEPITTNEPTVKIETDPMSVRLVNLFKRDYSVNNVFAGDPNAIAIPFYSLRYLERQIGSKVDPEYYEYAVIEVENVVLAKLKDHLDNIEQERLARVFPKLIKDDQLTPAGLGFLNKAIFDVLGNAHSNGIYDFAKLFPFFAPKNVRLFNFTYCSIYEFYFQSQDNGAREIYYEKPEIFQAIKERLAFLAAGIDDGIDAYKYVAHFWD